MLKEKYGLEMYTMICFFPLCIAQTLVNELRESSRFVGWEEMELELCIKC